MNIVKRTGPWLVSAAVHGAFLAAAIVTMTGVSAPAPEPAPAEDAVFSVTLRPGGRPSIEGVSKVDEQVFGRPTAESLLWDEAPREAFDDMQLVRSSERDVGRSRPSSDGHAAAPPSRSGGQVRFSSSGKGGGNPNAAAGLGTGTGSGVGEGEDEGVEAVPLETPKPQYPEEARRKQLEGTVLIEIRIDAAGRVASARVSEGSGRSILDDAAVAAVRTWSYRPATLNGKPISSIRRVQLTFRLE